MGQGSKCPLVPRVDAAATEPVSVGRAALSVLLALDNQAWHVVSAILSRGKELNSEACMVPEAVKRHVSVDIILPDLHCCGPARTYVCRDDPACLPPKVCKIQASMLRRRFLCASETLH